MKQRVYPWLIVVGWAFIVSATFELIVLGGSNFFRSVAVDLGVSVSQVALVVTVCSLSLAVSAPVAGRLFDKVDSRILLTAMGLIVVAAFASLSWGQHVWQWWLAGLLYGVGGSGILVIGAPIFIANWFAKRTGFAVGLFGMLIAVIATILNPVIAAAITAFGWRTAYLVLSALSAVMMFPWTIFVVRYRPSEIGLVPYGAEAQADGTDAQADASAPGVPYRRAVRSIVFVSIAVAAGAMCFMGGFKSTWSSIAQSDAWGFVASYGADWALMFGATMISATTVAKFFMPVIGWAIDRFGAVRTNCATIVVIMVGFLMLAFLHGIVPVVYVACFLVGFESCNMKMTIPLVVRELFGDRDYPKIYSLVYGIANFLGAFSAATIVYIGERSGSYNGAMALGIALCAITLAALVVASRGSRAQFSNELQR